MMTTAVKRACDACHRRKVKCDGINPCRNCSTAQLSCTYNAIPQKKGPKGSRAKVISELRETQRQSTLNAKVHGRLHGLAAVPSLAPTQGLLTSDLIKQSFEYFFDNMYSTMPILSRQRLEQQALYPENLDTYCLLTSLCALVLLQPGMTVPGTDPYGLETMNAGMVQSSLLLEETLRVRKGLDYLESPTLNTICTSYFIYAVHHILDLRHKSWYHLREATTLAHMVEMNREGSYGQWDAIESSRRRRLYWLLFVAERTHALRFSRPLTLEATINLPNPADDPSDNLSHQLNNFVMTAELFRQVDVGCVGLWSRARGNIEGHRASLQKQMDATLVGYNSSDSQFAELTRNQSWIRNMVWQINASQAHKNGDMSFSQYPVDVSHEILSMASSTAAQGTDMLNVNLVHKILALAADLTDYLPMQTASKNPYSVSGPKEHLGPLLNHIALMRVGEHRFMPLLLCKVQDIVSRLSEPKLLNAPEIMCPGPDIFDGFGNGGMAQPPYLACDDFKTEPRSSPDGSLPSNSDMGTTYVNSPSILSPGSDYPPHSLQTDFSSMSEMVMSPMSHGPNSALHTPGGMLQHGQAHSSLSGIPVSADMGQRLGMNSSMSGMSQTPVINGLLSQGFNNGSHGLPMVRPQSNRTNSYAMHQNQPQITVGSFQALQRANSDFSSMSPVSMGNMGPELNFNTLR